ncbi:MAG: glycosyltransferase [Bacteroidaceae bacterium]|nr:glycosyltransferase [Bacteroidaceae bacterium]
MKLSVIVPVYNVEKFLPRCLDSLLRQGLEVGEYEVICVNDGSPDNSAAILAEYEAKHPDVFKVITQENKGLGGARNTGMEAAQGEWIAFVDSDDYVIDDGYRYLLEHFCKEDIEVLQFSCVLAYTGGESLYDPDARPTGEVTFEGNGADLYNKVTMPYVWTKFYRRSFLEKHGIRFKSAFMEDEPFNFDVFSHSPRLCVVTSKVYRYEQGNANSILSDTNTEKVKRQLRWLRPIIEKMNRYLEQGGGTLLPAAKRNVNMYLRYYYNKMLKADLTRSEWKECIRAVRGLPVWKVDPSFEGSRLGKAIAHLKNLSATSYLAYRCTAWLTNVVFRQLVRPRIISSYTK